MARLPSVIPAAAQNAFHIAIDKIVGSFFKDQVIMVSRQTTTDEYGENPVIVATPYLFLGNINFTVGMGGRYHNVQRSDVGQILEEGWKVLLYKEEVDATDYVPNPEADSCVLDGTIVNGAVVGGTEYEIRMWTPSTSFADLGFLMYEFELHHNTGT